MDLQGKYEFFVYKGGTRGSASGLRQGSALHPRRVFDPLDTLFAIELVTLSYSVRVFIHRLGTLSTVSKQRAVPAALNPTRCSAEGFQRAIGKPFGRLRRGEIPCKNEKCQLF